MGPWAGALHCRPVHRQPPHWLCFVATTQMLSLHACLSPPTLLLPLPQAACMQSARLPPVLAGPVKSPSGTSAQPATPTRWDTPKPIREDKERGRCRKGRRASQEAEHGEYLRLMDGTDDEAGGGKTTGDEDESGDESPGVMLAFEPDAWALLRGGRQDSGSLTLVSSKRLCTDAMVEVRLRLVASQGQTQAEATCTALEGQHPNRGCKGPTELG